MSILLYNFKELTKSIEELERIEAKVNNKKKEWLLTIKKEEKQEEKEEMPATTLDSCFIKSKIAES
jgi:hypothetical protein